MRILRMRSDSALRAHHANSFGHIKNPSLFFQSFNIYEPSQGGVDLVLV